jgi:hypothetical protein
MDLRFIVADGVRFFSPDVLAQGIVRPEEPGSVVSLKRNGTNLAFCRGECLAKDAKGHPHPQLIPADEATAQAVGVPFKAAPQAEKKGS